MYDLCYEKVANHEEHFIPLACKLKPGQNLTGRKSSFLRKEIVTQVKFWVLGTVLMLFPSPVLLQSESCCLLLLDMYLQTQVSRIGRDACRFFFFGIICLYTQPCLF